MALTLTEVDQYVIGDRRVHIYDALGDNNYASGGEALTKNDLGFADAADPAFNVQVEASAGYVAEYDVTNELLKVYWVDTSVDGQPMQDAAGADLAAVTFRVTATGKYQR
jgi:hypothetical protein